MENDLVACNNTDGQIEALDMEYIPNEWQLVSS